VEKGAYKYIKKRLVKIYPSIIAVKVPDVGKIFGKIGEGAKTWTGGGATPNPHKT